MLKMFQKIEGIPWYRRRWFWGILIIPLIVFGIIIYFFELFPSSNLGYFIIDLAKAFGGLLIMTYVSGQFDYSWLGKIIGGIVYLFLYSFLVFKTFRYARVDFGYPILFILLVLYGLIPFIFLLLFGDMVGVSVK